MADSSYYVGTAGVRRMTAANWRNVGVKGQDTVSWNEGNGWAVPMADLGADARKYVTDNAESLGLVVMSENTRSPQAARPTDLSIPIVGFPDVPNPAARIGIEPVAPAAPTDEAAVAESGGTAA